MPKKLIEVALPLEAINAESAREKSIRHGHPSTLHLWWARRPLAAARAVIWSSLVDDPSEHPEQFPTEEEQNKERQRLFTILEKLVKWENSNDPEILDAAKDLAKKIEAGKVEVKIKTGEGGRTFGSVSSKEIAVAVKEQMGYDIYKKKIQMKDSIKNLGTYIVPVKLHAKVTAELKVHVGEA